MIEVVADKRLVTKYQKQFINQLKLVCNEKISCILGFQGESIEAEVFYSEKHNFWFTGRENYNRYWNAFGIGRPQEGRNVSIVVEINFPYEGIDRRIGAAFGKDSKGKPFVLHRGKIGGGREGIGKNLFFKEAIGVDQEIVIDGDRETTVFALGELNSKYLPKQISILIDEVNRVKNLTNDEMVDYTDEVEDEDFVDEATGTSRVERSGVVEINRTHGIVVNLLSKTLRDKGYKVGKDRNRDLFIHKNMQVRALFEIKRSSRTSDLYGGVGQLLIYSTPYKLTVDLVLVLPEKLNTVLEKRLSQLSIKILYYDWNEGEPIFKELDKLIKSVMVG